MTQQKEVKALQAEIAGLIKRHIRSEFVDKRSETTALAIWLAEIRQALAENHECISTTVQALANLVPQFAESNEATWSAVEMIVGTLSDRGKNRQNLDNLRTSIRALVGTETPKESGARYFLILSYMHTGGTPCLKTILDEEKFFRKDNPEFWFRLFIDAYQTRPDQIENKLLEYVRGEWLNAEQIFVLGDQLFEVLGYVRFPVVVDKVHNLMSDGASKSLISRLHEHYMDNPIKTKIRNTREFNHFLCHIRASVPTAMAAAA